MSIQREQLFDQFKAESLRKLQAAEDKSPKGSIDAPIVDLIALINQHSNYVTSSSCSGRIALFKGSLGVPSSAVQLGDDESNLITKGGTWLLSEHRTITFTELQQALETLNNNNGQAAGNDVLLFQHEPFILHVLCRNIDAADKLLQWGLSCGFRESGIVIGKKKIMCAIRTQANRMEIPIGATMKGILVNNEYFEWIVQIANEKFHANERKCQLLQKTFQVNFCSQNNLKMDEIKLGEENKVEIMKSQVLNTKIARIGHTSILHGESDIYIFGGSGPTASGNVQPLNSVLCCKFHRELDSFIVNEIPPYSQSPSEQNTTVCTPSGRVFHSVVVISDEMIVFGGRSSPNKPYNDMLSFNLVNHEWKSLECDGNYPSPRWKHVSCVIDSKMYVFGGRDSSKVFKDLYVIDLNSGNFCWNECKEAPRPMFDHVGVSIDNRYLMFYGGMETLYGDIEDACSHSWLCFDTVTSEWAAIPGNNSIYSAPPNIIGARAIALSGHILITGGVAQNTSSQQIIYSFDTANKTWELIEDTSNTTQKIDSDNEEFLPTNHTATWVPTLQSIIFLGGGTQVFGFGQFYSASLLLQISTIILNENSQRIIQNGIQSSKHNRHKSIPVQSNQVSLNLRADSNEKIGVLADKGDVKMIKTLMADYKVYDKTRRIHLYTDAISNSSSSPLYIIPVTNEIYQAISKHEELEKFSLKIVDDKEVFANKFGKSSTSNAFELIRNVILNIAEKNSHKLPQHFRKDMPKKFSIMGDVLLIPRDAFIDWDASVLDTIWQSLCSPPHLSVINCSRVARKAYIDPGEKRQSHMLLLYVNSSILSQYSSRPLTRGWVEIRENGLTYGLDITKVMFSSGNVTEKARMGNIGCTNDIIVDLFCGIGYYVIPFLVHGRAKFVHACEWNPDSVDALKFNLKKNGVADRCKIYEGDNQEHAPKIGPVADRVNLGLLPSSRKAWPLAVQVLKPTGGWLHVHENVAVEDRDNWEQYVVQTITQLGKEIGKDWNVTCEHIEKVKSYAPKVFHYVADIKCSPIHSSN